jgi:hypothetical protein
MPVNEGPCRLQGGEALAYLGDDGVIAGLRGQFQSHAPLDLGIAVREFDEDRGKALGAERRQVARMTVFLDAMPSASPEPFEPPTGGSQLYNHRRGQVSLIVGKATVLPPVGCVMSGHKVASDGRVHPRCEPLLLRTKPDATSRLLLTFQRVAKNGFSLLAENLHYLGHYRPQRGCTTYAHCSSVSGHEIARHPPPVGRSMVGGRCGSLENLPGAPFSVRKQCVATALRCAGFQAAAN